MRNTENIQPAASGFQSYTEEEQALLQALHKWYTAAFPPLQGFFQSEFRALVYLVEHGSAAPSDLAGPLNVTRQRVTTILTGLRNKGYITMEMDPADRRRMRVQLTEEGNRYFVEQSSTLAYALQYMRDRLGSEGINQLTELIDRLIPEGENSHEKE